MTTGQLIDLYHRERLNDQHVMLQQYQACGESPPYGTLCVRVYYRNECLFVEIINARHNFFTCVTKTFFPSLLLIKQGSCLFIQKLV